MTDATFKGGQAYNMTPEGIRKVTNFSADSDSALRSRVDDISAARKFQDELTPDIVFEKQDKSEVVHQNPFKIDQDPQKQQINRVID